MSAGQSASPYGWRLATLKGVPVYLGRSWPIIAVVVVVLFAPGVVDPSTGERGGTFGYVVGVAYALLLLLSVLAHEAAHAVVAARLGHRVDRVVADLWGGHTVYDGGLSRPGRSAAIAVAGPAANLALAGAAYAMLLVVPGGGVTSLLLAAVTYANVLVGVFNLLPGLPLDGGYVVDALVWKVTGSRHTGLIVAGWLGRILTAVLVALVVGRPLLQGRTPSLYGIVWTGLIGAFLWVGASNAIRSGAGGRAVERVPLAQVLRPVAGVSGDEPLAQVLARMSGFAGLVVVWDRSGRPVGLVDREAARSADPHSVARGLPTSAVTALQPQGWVVAGDPHGDVSAIVDAVAGASVAGSAVPPVVLVLDQQGRPLGSVTMDDLDTALRTSGA
ncbi:site-2 protease family protein [Dermatophilaceae bacterium Soc4.6]